MPEISAPDSQLWSPAVNWHQPGCPELSTPVFLLMPFAVERQNLHCLVMRRPELTAEQREELRQYHELRAKLEASDALRIQRTARLGRTRFYTYEVNMRELFSLVCSHSGLQREGRLGDALNRKPLNDFLYECTRRLQNFVSSAVSLINYSKKIVESDHRQNKLVMKSFREGETQHLDSPIHGFTVAIRECFTHDEPPSIASVMSGSDEPENYWLKISAEQITKIIRERRDRGADRDNQNALKYLELHSDGVDLMTYVEDYHQTVMRFVQWFDEAMAEWDRAAWEYGQSLQGQIKALEARWQSGEPSAEITP